MPLANYDLGDIDRLVFQRVADATTLPANRYYPDDSGERTGEHVSVYILESATTTPPVNAEYRQQFGLVQVSCYAPAGRGAGLAAKAIAQAVIELFPAGLRLGQAAFTEQPSASPVMNDGGFEKVVVTAPYTILSL